MAAGPAIGAVITGLIMARMGTFRNQGKLIIGSVAVFGLATAGFGLSHVFWFSLLMLSLAGSADMVSTVLRQTIRQLVTPDQLRGRMTSINMVFFDTMSIGSSPDAFASALKKEGVLAGGASATAVRFVTHKDVNASDVDRAIKGFAAVVAA